MSFLGVASVASEIAGALFGSGVSIGGIALTQFEVPDAMPWGTDQQVAVHDLPGGGRVVHPMGAWRPNYQWSGTFLGSNAVQRAQSIDALVVAGQTVTLAWGSFSRQVVIQSFRPNYRLGGALVPYQITCIDVPLPPGAAAPTLGGSLFSDVTDALGITSLVQAAGPVLTTVTTALNSVQSVIPLAGAITGGSAAALSIGNSLGSAISVTSGVVSAANAGITAIGNAGSLAGGSPPGTAASALSSAGNLVGQLAGATGVGALLGRMSSNLLAAA